MATNPRAHHDPDSPGRDPRGGLTRREILGGLAAVTAVAGGVGALPLRASGSPRIAVVGAGAFGGWTALHLLRKGADVTLFDAWGPGNPRSSSGGEGRAIRAIYGPDRIYTEWVARAFELWAELERGADAHLYEETGALWMMENDDRLRALGAADPGGAGLPGGEPAGGRGGPAMAPNRLRGCR